jgi:hypothetical protein
MQPRVILNAFPVFSDSGCMRAAGLLLVELANHTQDVLPIMLLSDTPSVLQHVIEQCPKDSYSCKLLAAELDSFQRSNALDVVHVNALDPIYTHELGHVGEPIAT